MNAIELLTQQHAVIDDLIRRVEHAKHLARRDAFEQLAEVLHAHIKIEEGVFYPAVLAKPTDDDIIERLEEHLQIKWLLSELRDCHPDDEWFDVTLATMRELHDGHAHGEEERGMFPAVAKVFTEEELLSLGLQMELLYDELTTPSIQAAIRPVIESHATA
jgi:hypothetical protein